MKDIKELNERYIILMDRKIWKKMSIQCESNSHEVFHRTWQNSSKIDKGEEITKNKQTILKEWEHGETTSYQTANFIIKLQSKTMVLTQRKRNRHMKQAYSLWKDLFSKSKMLIHLLNLYYWVLSLYRHFLGTEVLTVNKTDINFSLHWLML